MKPTNDQLEAFKEFVVDLKQTTEVALGCVDDLRVDETFNTVPGIMWLGGFIVVRASRLDNSVIARLVDILASMENKQN